MRRRDFAIVLTVLALLPLSACGTSQTAAARTPHTLQLSHPIGSIAAEGTTVAAAPEGNHPVQGPQQPMRGVLWDTATGHVDILKLPRTCADPWGTSLSGSRMAIVCDESCCTGIEQQVVVAQPGRDPVTVMRVTSGLGTSGEIDSLAGGGKLILFARDTVNRHFRVIARSLYRIEDDRARVLETGESIDQPWFVSHGLILVAHSPFRDPRASFLYDGRAVYDQNDGAPGVLTGRPFPSGSVHIGVCMIGRGTTLGGVSGGYVTYTTANAVHVIRMSDCRDALVAGGPGVPAGSAITPAGLFYAFDARPIGEMDTDATMARIHSTLTFVPMARVARAVSRGLRLGGP